MYFHITDPTIHNMHSNILAPVLSLKKMHLINPYIYFTLQENKSSTTYSYQIINHAIHFILSDYFPSIKL